MKLEALILGIMLFCLIMVTSFFMIGDFNTIYGTNISSENRFNNSMTYINDTLYGLGIDMKNSSIDADISGGSETWDSMVKGSYTAIRFVVGAPFVMFSDIIQQAASLFGIAPIYASVAYTALIILVVFSIIYLFLRWRSF